MGLDNGLILHSKEKVEFPQELNTINWVYEDGMYHYEICYWRKCWNIRREMAYIINAEFDYVAKYGLDIEEIKNLWRAINDLNSKRSWETGDSFWTYEEIKNHLITDLLRLEWLISFMQIHKKELNEKIWVEFYDSY